MPSTNFSGYTTSQQPNDWTRHGTTGTFIVAEDAGATGGKWVAGDETTYQEDHTAVLFWDDNDGEEVEVLGTVRVAAPDGTNRGQGGVIIRGSVSAGNLTGYIASFDRSGGAMVFALYRVSGRSLSLVIRPDQLGPMNSVATSTFDSSAFYNIRLRAEGGAIKAKHWKVGESEPGSWDIEETDGSPLGSGSVGLANTQTFSSHQMRWDTFQVDQLAAGFAHTQAVLIS